MSRVGRMPIPVPEGVEVDFEGGKIAARGPLGTLSRSISPDMSIELSNGVLTVSRPTDSKTHRSLHGLTRTLIANMVQGVSEGFHKDLEIVGVGYRAQLSGEKLIFQLGYSHPVEVSAPQGISFSIKGTNKVMVSGIDKELVGKVSAQIRALRPPDHYKGKGVRYSGEQVRLKAGKSGKAKK
ncbi:50S ribosomal protein L6 [Dehalococcoidia bacterium]|nr:50S ribosomal protein L6 [Dehalococcoidia bacterium]MCL0073441.1 50S ribosomal protein L6 [Dehalococcoidia bacterium]MCL0088374.1 50S ribosomal protein L6 [Dehalococcoidia bacterium]MCL0102813.1 50S ribosomal protein L6 [Dehalococcoidia bacterium]